MDRIDSKPARARLKPRKEPYWFRLGPGRHLGYRAEGKTWIAKYRDSATGERPQKALGTIEPSGKKDSFHVALAQATAWFEQTAAGIAPKGTDVATVCRDYVAELRGKGRTETANDAEGRFRRLVYDKPLGAHNRDQLKRTHLVQWFATQLPSDKTDAERLRKAKDSANRNRTALLAALNLAVVNGKFATDFAWRAFKPHGNVGGRRERVLDRSQRKRLLQAATSDVKAFCEASLLLACRPGELANANVADFDRKAGSLVLSGKTGRRVVQLSTAAVELCARCSKGRIGAVPLLTRANGSRWDRFSWRDGIRDAAKSAKLPADVCAYTLRHTSLSELISGGVDPLTVSRLSGTSLVMIQKHYGHLIRTGLRDKLDAVRLV